MTRTRMSVRSVIAAGAMAFVMMGTVGCSHESEPPPPPPPGVVPTAAQQGSLQNTLAHNPPAGQPNHISPEQQKELERYQSLGNGAPQAPASAPGQ